MREFLRYDQALPAPQLHQLRHAALTSDYVGNSPLVGTFQASRGFAVTFTDEGREDFPHRFPFLEPFLQLALDPRSFRRLFTWRERLTHRLVALQPNGFFLNLLLVPSGARVGPHVDATLQRRAQVEAFPLVVSVLYLQVPRPGGKLRLSRDGRMVAEIQPQEGTLIHFRGDLTHEVTTVGGETGALRASLVCEQYSFAEGVLARLPRFAVRSQGRFQSLLHQTKGRQVRGEWDLPERDPEPDTDGDPDRSPSGTSTEIPTPNNTPSR